MKRFFVRKSRLCLLALLCALFFVRISYADNIGINCEYVYSDDGKTLTIQPKSGDECTLPQGTQPDTGFPWANNKTVTKVVINGKVKTQTNAAYLFGGLKNAETWEGLDNLDTSAATNLTKMFYQCEKLSDISALDSWKTQSQNFTDISYMFYYCKSLTSLEGLGAWNVSNITAISGMFSGCNTLKDISALAGWTPKKVTSLSSFFFACYILKEIGVLANWKDSLADHLTDTNNMFHGCESLTNLGAIKDWNVSNVTNMGHMFNRCSSLTNLDLNWDVGNVTIMYDMFRDCSSLTNLDAIKGWNVSKVTNMEFMFCNCTSLTNLNSITGWKVGNVTNMEYMFYNCSSLTNLDAIKGWNVSKVTNMEYMFYDCKNAKTADFSGSAWNFADTDVSVSYMLNGIDGAAINLNSYADDMGATKVYVYGKHSEAELTLREGSNGSALIYEPYVVTVTYTGPEGSSATATFTAEAGHAHTSPEAYYNAVKALDSTKKYVNDGNTFYMNSGKNVTLDFAPGAGYVVKSVEINDVVKTAPYSITNITADQNVQVTLEKTPATVTYDANGGSGTVPTYNGHVGDTITLSDGTGLSKTGYQFMGWSVDGGITTLPAGSSYEINATAVTMKAVWAQLYTLSYSAGDGSGSIAPESKIAGTTMTVKAGAGVMTKTGYTFKNWIDLDDSNKSYEPNAQFSMPTRNMTLTAQYTINSYTLSYSAGEGGAGTIDPETKEYDSEVTVKAGLGVMTKTGHTFSDWKRSDTGGIVQAGATFNMPDKDVTLTAQYTINSYNLTYDPGIATGGNVPAQATTVVYNKEVTVAANSGNLEKTGYVFGGWKRSDNNETVQPGAKFNMPASNLILTAHFGKLYKLTYAKGDAKTGDVPSPEEESIVEGMPVTVKGNTGSLAKPGYSFTGWLYDDSTTTKVYKQDDTFEMPSANVTLTAQFSKNATIEIGEAKSGTLPEMPAVDAGDPLTLPFNTGGLAYDDYPFIGWVDQDGNEYDKGETIPMPAGTLTLKPLFSKVQYTLRYNAGEAASGAVPAAVPVYYKVNTTLDSNTGNLAKTGYNFKGWRYGSTVYPAGSSFRMPKENVEMTAVFGLGSYTITYEMGEATSGTVPDPQTVDFNTSVTLRANTRELAKGSVPYIGWTDGVTEYAETQSFLMPANDMTLKPLFSTYYKLSFAAGEAEAGSAPAPMDVYYGTSTTIPDNGTLAKEGYVFKCWKDNNGTEYLAGASYEMPKANTTLTAVFIPNSRFDITYEVGDAESGTAPAPQTGIPAGTTVTLAGNSGGLAKQGYEFVYWSDGLKWYGLGSDFQMPSEDVTLRPYFVIVLRTDPLPEDEIGTYYYNESGQKEYVQFHNYDICMNYMGDDNLCRNTSVNLYN